MVELLSDLLFFKKVILVIRACWVFLFVLLKISTNESNDSCRRFGNQAKTFYR